MLDKLALKYGTDKSSAHHDYAKVYEQYLAPFQDKKISLIEIGVGGYHYPDRGGESLKIWHEYFQHGKIIGIDIHPKENIINDRTEFWQGSQDDEHLLGTILKREENADIRIVIDDASHINALTIKTFNIIFPLLKSGEYYFIEDVHTSYWQENYGGNEIPGSKGTTMQYFTMLTHQLNHETLLPEFRNEFAGIFEFIHFYKEMIVIKRK